MGFRTIVMGVCLVVAWPGTTTAQDQRYELGRRLKLFEAEWERQPDPKARERALEILPAATKQFLTLQLSAAARTLDDARFALRSATPPTPAERWLAALAVVVDHRLVEPAESGAVKLDVEIRPLYELPGEPTFPGACEVRLETPEGRPDSATSTRHEFESLPTRFTPPCPVPMSPTGDDILASIVISARGKRVAIPILVSVIPRFSERFAVARAANAAKLGAIERATVKTRIAELHELSQGGSPETDVPAARLLNELEAVLGIRGDTGTFAPDKNGQVWLTIPTPDGETTPCRVYVPPGLDARMPIPVVVALHGVGGSENMFFEGYGAGCVAKACAERGWVLVCPRGGLGFFGGPPPVPDIVAALAERYPIDTDRVFLVGHSMGAAQTVDLVGKHPDKFAAVAVLGGGGKVRHPKAFADVPTFIGIGTADFARSGAVKLHRELTAAGAKRVTLREYPGVEHLVIVRAAVDDVFAEFDRVVSPIEND